METQRPEPKGKVYSLVPCYLFEQKHFLTVQKVLQDSVSFFFLGLSNPQRTTEMNVYDEVREYEELKETEEKQYENHGAVDKICVSLKPMLMETLRDHIQSTVSLLSYQRYKTNCHIIAILKLCVIEACGDGTSKRPYPVSCKSY